MRIVATGFGGPGMLAERATEHILPRSGEVAIKVMAIGVNAVDRKLYASRDYTRSHGEPPPEFPLALGVEAAGVVTAVGDHPDGPAGPIQVGDEVIAYRIQGAYADQLVIPAASVVPKPSRLSWARAASMMLVGTTAAHALAAVRARPGDTVLLHGAGGGVGTSVLQLAKLQDVHVIGTGGDKDFDTILALGGVPVRYGEGLAQRVRQLAQDGVDAVIDAVGTDEAIAASLSLVRDRTRVATLVAFARARELGFQALGGAPGQDVPGIAVRDHARLRLTALVEAGAFATHVAHMLPLGDAAVAHRMLDDGIAGRIVLLTAATALAEVN